MSKEESVFNLRLPVELKEKVVESASRNKRSINSEIIAAIEYSQSVGPEIVMRTPILDLEKRVKDIEEKLLSGTKKAD